MQGLLRYEDVARLTQFKISTLRKWVQLRKMPFVKINGSIRFRPEEIRAWAAGEQAAGNRDQGAGGVAGGGGELFSCAEGRRGNEGH